MLGLASVLTASSTSEQLYSLTLDGTGDYLVLGDVLDRGTGDFSVSFWAKITHEDIDDQSFISKRVDSNYFWRIRTVNAAQAGAGKIYAVGKGNGDSVGDTAFAITGGEVMDSFLNTWVHICVTIDRDGDGVIYVNGYTDVHGTTTDISGATPEAVNLDNTGDLEIGAFAGSGMEGNMDEVAIWNVALDEDAVVAIYNDGKPFNLNNDRGNYDNSSALEGYWRMGNGSFDDIANGVVHDAHNPGLGSEFVTDNEFPDTTNWATTDDIDEEYSGEGVLISTNPPDSGQYGGYYQNDIDLVDGKVYKVEYDCLSIDEGGDTGTIKFIVLGDLGNGGDKDYRPLPGGLNGDPSMAVGKNVYYFRFDQASNNDVAKMKLYIQMTNGDAYEKSIRLKSVSIKQLNGYPGLTSGNPIFSADTPDDQAMSSVMMLDGAADYLEASGLAGSDFPETGSISFWVKGDFSSQGINAGDLFDKYDGSDLRNHIFIRDYTGSVLQIACQDDSPSYRATDTITVIDDQWNHVVVTWDTSALVKRLKGYVNGNTTPVVDVEIDVSGGWTPDGQVMKFGDGHEGSMDEIAIFNAVLDGNAVAAVYGAGRNYDLTADTGNYTNASDLQSYWRMGDGNNEDLTNGIIFDQVAPTIGSNLVPEPSFETVTGWSDIAGDGTSAVDTSFSHSGDNSWKLVVDGGADSGGRNVGVESTDYFTVEANTVYRVSWWSYCPSGNGSRYVQVGGSSSGTDWHRLGDTQTHNGDSIPADTWTKLTYYFRTSSGTDLKLKLTNGAADGDADDIRWFDDIELVKIGGNPGIAVNDAMFIKQPI